MTRRNRSLVVSALVALALTGGCSFYARGPDAYRQAVRNVVDTKAPAVETCYKSAKEQNPQSQGAVVVRFDVEPKTGDIVRPEIVKEQTNADETLQRCVLESLAGLKLDPPDQRLGQATFRWDFRLDTPPT
jgi:hypothetical protein